MVPYVRKSFYKHFIDGMKYIEEQEVIGYDDTLSIDSELYRVRKKAYNYALDKTEKELQQAVEGMYHNLEIWA